MDTLINDRILYNLSTDVEMEKATIFEWDITKEEISYYNGSVEKNHLPRIIKNLNLSSPFINENDIPTILSVENSIKQGKLYNTADFRIQGEGFAYTWYRIHAITQYDSHDKPVKAIGILFDIDKEMDILEKLRFKAERDSLTGLYNRKEAEENIKQYLLTNPKEWCALFIIDTDNFKAVNDTKGHMLGDMVLTELASGMTQIMRDIDIIARIGGDEFAIFMKNISNKEDALKKADNLIDMFNHLFANEKKGIQVTCSIGIAFYPEDGMDFKTLYDHADKALYQAKKQGKNRYIQYDPTYAYVLEGHKATTLGAAIDSEAENAEIQNSFLGDIFKILYRSEDIDQAINLTLKITGERFDVSRAYVFENTDDGRFSSNIYEWCGKGVRPEIDNLQDVDYAELNHYDRLFDDNAIFYCRDVRQLKGEQMELFQSQGIRSILQVAFYRDDQFAGFIGFDECTGLRLWTKEEVDTLSLISQILSTFLQKKRALEQSSTMKQQMKTILDAQDSCIYVIDQNTFELLYQSPKMKTIRQSTQLGDWCYKALFDKDVPCEFCPIHHGGTGEFHNSETGHLIPIHASSMKWLGNDAYLISFHQENIQPCSLSKKALHRPAEKSIVDCIQWLTSSEYIEDSIEYVLNIIQDYYRSDRVYIIETDEKNGDASNTYEICAEGVTPQIDKLQHVPIRTIKFWMNQFEGKGYIKIDNVEELKEDRHEERDILKAQGIHSLMAIPLYVKEELKGFLGIDDPKRHKKNFHYLKGLSYFLENEISKNAMRRNLEKMSYEDALTGLENRNSYMKYYDDFSLRMPNNIGVVFMDINGLKRLNNSRGHVYGDMMVSLIADIMREYFPEERKFRLSGDEFLLITESLDYEQFMEQLKSMEKALSEDGSCSVAIGKTWSDLYTELSTLLSNSERLMHIHKNEYYKKFKEFSVEKIPLLEGLVTSIANKDYLIYLQPQLHVATNQVDSAEVLVRYREKDGSILAPIKFIPMLEAEGLISNVDFFVMEETCKLLEKWNKLGHPMKLAFNFSRITLFDETFMEQFWRIFHAYDIQPEQLEIEITETQEFLNKKQIVSILKNLKAEGFQIALDDFGVGYSSYEFLMISDFDFLKIDKGVTQRLYEAKQSEVLIKHIVQMGHDMGISSCAEGVETEEQYQFMCDIKCDYIQGYLIDKPMPIHQFEDTYIKKK